MGNLFLSFTIAIGAAIGFVSLSSALNIDSYTGRIIPLVPILYAIIYEVLDHRKGGKASRRATQLREAAPAKSGLSVGKIVVDVAVSFFIKFSVELFLVSLYLRYSGQTFSEAYGTFGIDTISRFARGEHPWLVGKEGLWLLALVALVTIFVTGSWIGRTSRGNAILEGVLAGASITVINSMTNMLVLYRSIEDITVRLADSMGYVMRAGFLVVIGLQVLLYGLWSGIVQMQKQDE